jgi:SET and MYND domain-containing protein
MYCSEECHTSSWISNHYIDCPLLGVLQKLEIGKMGFLALRIIIKVCKGQNLESMLKSVEDDGKWNERNKGFNDDGTYSSSDYSPIYWLVGNTEKRSVGDLFRRAVIAACILKCLETMTDFFPLDTTSPSESSRQKRLVGGLLLRHLQNLPCNAHEVSELVGIEAENDREDMSMWKSIEIGAAAYAMLSLVNHSCDPNVVRHSCRGDTAVLRAIRPIARGEQVRELPSVGTSYIPCCSV